MNLAPLQGLINAFSGILQGAQNNPQQYQEPGDWFEQTQDNPFALILHSIMNLLRVGFDKGKSKTQKIAETAKTAVGIIFGILSLLVPKPIMTMISGFFKPIMNVFKGLFGGGEQAQNQAQNDAPEGEVRLEADAEANADAEVELEAEQPAVQQQAPQQQNVGQAAQNFMPMFGQLINGVNQAFEQRNQAEVPANNPADRPRVN